MLVAQDESMHGSGQFVDLFQCQPHRAMCDRNGKAWAFRLSAKALGPGFSESRVVG